MKSLATFIASFGYVGYLRPASGTWGSAAAIPVGFGIHLGFGTIGLAVAAVAIFFVGWWATMVHTAGGDNHDPSEVVVDEVAGQWVALLPVSFILHSDDSLPLWLVLSIGAAAFFLFRLFDIWKPGPVGWADRRDDPFGVMFDDVIAGAFAALVLLAGFAGLAYYALSRIH